MDRTALTDGTKKWFNKDSSIIFMERNRCDNDRSVNHERLYYTKSDAWILEKWVSIGGRASYEQINLEEAALWIIRENRMDKLDNLRAGVRTRLEAALAESEV